MMTKDEIELLDGRTIVGYPKEKVEQRNMDRGFLALTKEAKQKEKERLQRLFLDNAFGLLDAHDRIQGDSRMFLTPAPIESGLAYVGSGGFSCPTLGIYIEWWLTCPYSSVEDKDGHKWLIYKLAGSPLSGRNQCSLVDRDGNTKKMELLTFREACKSFLAINRRYKNAKEQYYGFSLLQTMSLLEKEGLANIKEREDLLFSQEKNLQTLTAECNRLQKANEELTAKFHHTLMRLKVKELKTYLQELKQKEEKLTGILDYANEDLPRMRLQQGNTSDYQKEQSRVRKEKRTAMLEYNRFMHETLFDILEGEPIGLHEVERFLREKKN